MDIRALLPSIALACWGFADSQIQVYIYWLLGHLFEAGDDHSRAVGFFKCVQSLGYSAGFYLTPLTRLTARWQLGLSSLVYIVGTVLAFWQLPASGYHMMSMPSPPNRSFPTEIISSSPLSWRWKAFETMKTILPEYHLLSSVMKEWIKILTETFWQRFEAFFPDSSIKLAHLQ